MELFKPIKNEAVITEAFNMMPFEYRKIAADSEILVRIRDLQRMKKRINANYLRELKFIDDTIANYERNLKAPLSESNTQNKG